MRTEAVEPADKPFTPHLKSEDNQRLAPGEHRKLQVIFREIKQPLKIAAILVALLNPLDARNPCRSRKINRLAEKEVALLGYG